MKHSIWQLHRGWLLLAVGSVQLLTVINALAAPLKAYNDIDWLDIAGEGGMAVVIFCWLIMVLASRPAGRVTNLLAAGLLALFIGSFQDASDEILRMGPGIPWHGLVESITLPAGMLLLTLGLFQWHKEQQVISGQLRKREQLFREHKQLDAVTQISDIAYLKDHIGKALARENEAGESFSLALLDLDNFHRVNQQFGNKEGDRILLAVAELLILNLRDSDLLCRFAGDRFAILFPATRVHEAEKITEELCDSIKYFAYRSSSGERVYLAARAGIVCANGGTREKLIERAKMALLTAKQGRQKIQVAA